MASAGWSPISPAGCLVYVGAPSMIVNRRSFSRVTDGYWWVVLPRVALQLDSTPSLSAAATIALIRHVRLRGRAQWRPNVTAGPARCLPPTSKYPPVPGVASGRHCTSAHRPALE